MNIEVRFDIDGRALGPKLPTCGQPGYDGPYFTSLPLQLPLGTWIVGRTITELEAISEAELARQKAAGEAFYARQEAR